MTPEIFVQLLRWASLLSLVAALVAAPASRAQQPVRRPTPIVPPRTQPPPQQQPGPQTPDPAAPTRATEPPATAPVDKKEIHTNARTVVMSFDKRDLTEVIQFVSQFTQRNFILPERVSGKITILSNSPIPADDVWNVFVAALDANNWAVYPVGKYWKLVEKKQSSRANIPIYLERGQDAPPTEQMVTKIFKLKYVEADQMRNVLSQLSSRDSDLQIFPPDTLIVSDLKMPGLSGIALHDRLMTERPALINRMIFSTGDVASPDARTFIERVQVPVLQKPFELATLDETIARYMAAGK